ncbi:MAG: FAD-dependent monooxygenase [Vicinamibacterales bacterium]
MPCTHRIAIVGAGPAGLAAARAVRQRLPRAAVTVHEARSQTEPAVGTGIVLPRTALDAWRQRDPELVAAIEARALPWSTLRVFTPGGQTVDVAGHPYVSLTRTALVDALADLAVAAGARVEYEREITSTGDVAADIIVAADGAGSRVRDRAAAGIRVDRRGSRNPFVWLTTPHRVDTFTFLFAPAGARLWCAHAYPVEGGSTVLVEGPDAAIADAGLTGADGPTLARRFTDVFAAGLGHTALTAPAGGWRTFETIRCTPWTAGPVVLIGDAAHTAHFSVGSGTRLALDDAFALADALADHDRLDAALHTFEAARRPAVESLQRAAQASAAWFEGAGRYAGLDADRFAFSLLTRSLRMTRGQLAAGDAAFVERVDRLVVRDAAAQSRAHGSPASTSTPAPARISAGSTPSGAAAPAVVPPMFTPVRLRDLVIPNRVVVSPMCQYMAEDGMPTDWHVVHLGSRAIGGAGLVIAEMTNVTPGGRITPGCAGLYRDAHVDGWTRVVDFVHEHTPSKIGIQLGHAGRKGSTVRPWEGRADEPLRHGGWPVVAPSAVPFRPDRSPVPHALTHDEMAALVDDFAHAVERADAAGFDLIELHMAHGYLLSSFISPLANRREDEYGGTLENRLRFPLEVLDACRKAWPGEKPLTVRISAVEWADGGTTEEDAVAIARALAAHGADAVDCSSGFTTPAYSPFARQFQTPFADRLRHEAGVATMAVGVISSYDDVNTIVAAGRADLVLLGREHLFNPYWTRHAAAMQGYDLPWPPAYMSMTGYRSRSGLRFE